MTKKKKEKRKEKRGQQCFGSSHLSHEKYQFSCLRSFLGSFKLKVQREPILFQTGCRHFLQFLWVHSWNSPLYSFLSYCLLLLSLFPCLARFFFFLVEAHGSDFCIFSPNCLEAYSCIVKKIF
jgi:hypothetical protein